MSDELIKELSRLQLLSSRCKNKMSMCPLSITLEENRAYLIFNYIKELKEEKQENQKYKEVINKLKEDLNLIIEYGDGEGASRYDKQYGEFAKNHLKYMNAFLKEVK